jgi:hypothetical protein
VSLFVLSTEIEDRDEIEAATGRSTKRPSTLNDIHTLFYLQADHKKKSDMNLQFSNFKTPVIPNSLLQYY